MNKICSLFISTLCGSLTLSAAHATSPSYHLLSSSGPYAVVAPILSDDPSAGDRLAGQFYFNLSTSSFNAIDSTGNVVTLGSTYTSQPPQVTVLTTTTGVPYDTPAGARYLRVRMVGGGSGGHGSGSSGSGAGGTGQNTTFGPSLIAGGGSATAGGSVSGLGASDIGFAGANGSISGGVNSTAPAGASSPFGGAGCGNNAASAGCDAVANTGSGGGGAGGSGTFNPGNGGSAGGYVEALITSPAPSYSFTIGSGGSGGAGGTGGAAGGKGGSGIIIVEAFFN